MSKQKKKNNSDILILKIVKQEDEIANFELDTGAIDLAVILSSLRSRIPNNQKEKYDKFFFGASQENKSTELHNSGKQTLQLLDKPIKDKNPHLAKEVLPWLKKLYKAIVKRSHPDKYINFPIKAIKEKFINVYMDAVTALKDNDAGLMLLCAYEVELDIDSLNAKNYIIESIKKYEKSTSTIKGLMGYQWYHAQDDKRLIFLEKYLLSLGYKIDKKEAEDIIINRPPLARKRKAGSRPEKNPRFEKNL